MFNLSITPHTNQAEAATAVSFLGARRNPVMGRNAGQSVCLAVRCVR